MSERRAWCCPEPKYFALWRHITERLQPGERLPGGKPKPEVARREAQDALIRLASQWKERFAYIGLRAFGSQLLCEQVVGRGLRRMDYTPDPETGLLTEEDVDMYGIPCSVIPYKGRETKKSAPEDRLKNHVRALPERQPFEMRFPAVEGYAFALQRHLIKADIDRTAA